MFLALNQVTHGAPIDQKRIEKGEFGCPELITVKVEHRSDASDDVLAIRIDSGRLMALDKRCRERLHRFTAEVPDDRQLMLRIASPQSF